MLNNGNDIPYNEGIDKYLPFQDVQRLKKGMSGWYYDGIAFVNVPIIEVIGDETKAHYKGATVHLPTTRIFSDKTLAEAIERLDFEKNKKTEESKEPEFIKYPDNIQKYLPAPDIENLTDGDECWCMAHKGFLKGVFRQKNGISYALYVSRGYCFRNAMSGFYSDKTLAEAIEKLAIGESKKKEGLGLQKEPEFNVVTKPKHYMLFPEAGIEVRDLVKILLNRASANGYSSPMFLSDQAQMLQYILRFDAKNGKEDLEKARWYLDKMIESLSNSKGK